MADAAASVHAGLGMDSCAVPTAPSAYRLEEQVGFLIRRAHQRASAIFQRVMESNAVSPLQFAVLVKMRDEGRISQNHLGRLTFMDPATVMGVVQRLSARDLIRRVPDAHDRRRLLLTITSTGLRLVEDLEAQAHQVTRETLEPLSDDEQRTLLQLLGRLI